MYQQKAATQSEGTGQDALALWRQLLTGNIPETITTAVYILWN